MMSWLKTVLLLCKCSEQQWCHFGITSEVRFVAIQRAIQRSTFKGEGSSGDGASNRNASTQDQEGLSALCAPNSLDLVQQEAFILSTSEIRMKNRAKLWCPSSTRKGALASNFQNEESWLRYLISPSCSTPRRAPRIVIQKIFLCWKGNTSISRTCDPEATDAKELNIFRVF